MSKVETRELIIIEQLPIIREQLKLISAEIDEKLSIVDGLVVSEESLKEVKKIRAEFNKDFAEYEEKRKAVKKAVTDPYTQFEAVFKECVSDKFNTADKTLKAKISTVEDELREKKMEKVRIFFEEYAESQGVAEYASFLAQMSDLRTSYSMNEFKRISKERIDPLVSGLEAIKAQPEELQAEIMAEFKKSRKATVAITVVAERHKAIEEQKKQQEEREARQAAESEAIKRVEQAAPTPEALAPPTAAPIAKPDDDPTLQVTFTVTGKRSKLRELKQYLEDGGYQYE